MTSHDVLPAGGTPRRSQRVDALSIVMPAYNEGDSVRSALAAVREAARAADWELRIIVVDDGSDDPASVGILDELGTADDVRVLRQANAGRFAARMAGLDAVDSELVLLLDARVEVEADSLRHLREAVEDGVDVWNFDVTPVLTDLGSSFWTGITKVWWRDYFRDRRHVAFGASDFDRFPKGTGAFFAPTSLLREALGTFDSLFADARLASDDTRLLREVATRRPINLSPAISSRHRAKAGAGQWTRQCYYRGTTFVDGYLRDPARARTLLMGGGLVLTAGAALTIRAPRSVAGAAAVGCLGAGALTRWSGGSARESAAVGLLSPAFGLLFGAGVVRGLRMALGPRG